MHFDAVKQFLNDRGIEYEVRPRMVRGLDYYMRTTFEVVHGSLGAQNSVLGGGRYDGLAESLGSKIHSPGIGFSIGEDRLVMSVEGEQSAVPLDLFIAPLGEPALRHTAIMARDFRRAGLSVELAEGKVKRAMELANKLARALYPDRRRQRIGRRTIPAQEHVHGRAAGSHAGRNCREARRGLILKTSIWKPLSYWIFWATFTARICAEICAPRMPAKRSF